MKRMTRMDSNLGCAVRFENKKVKGTVTNLSMNGLFSKLEEHTHARVSDLVEVELFPIQPEYEVQVVMECKIARVQGMQYAFQLHAIDYDSLINYKKLLSEICGNEAVIDEELMAFDIGFDEISATYSDDQSC